jgi:dihydropteroate synthase
MFFEHQTINCRGRLLSLEKPVVMGILNVTPDSFFDGGRYMAWNDILRQTEKMLREGAAIIDVGGVSSRPGANPVDEEEELRRVLPAVSLLAKEFPGILISIDTARSGVAKACVEAGAGIINDISAGRPDEAMYHTVASLGVPYVLMHKKGNPQTMQDNPVYEDVVQEILDFFIAEIARLRQAGVKDILLDPGFGFGKTVQHNYQLLKNLHVFRITDLPILAGLSRKSMICKVLGINPEKAMNGTTALHIIALQQGARILRVHDVKEAMEVILLWEALENVN